MLFIVKMSVLDAAFWGWREHTKENSMAFSIENFSAPQARALPVFLLLDRSGSMEGEKIETLNKAVNDMVGALSREDATEVNIEVCAISFGAGGATVDIPLTPVGSIQSANFVASGNTPMGDALTTAKAIIEDKEQIPSKGFRPTVVLVSDGEPNDEWEAPMDAFINTGRTAKCDRFALAIGTSQDDPVLNRFVEGTETKVFLAEDASKISKFFRFVTMSVTTKSRQGKTGSKSPSNSNALIGAQQKSVADIAKEFGF